MTVRMAMPVHHTPTMKGDWDGGAMVARIPDDAGASVLKQMYAYMDPEGDPEAKSSYKMPHHMVSEGGEVGAANMQACMAAVAALNGARGGADIPDADRQKVWDHLAAHMQDGDMEPPELKSRSGKRALERRAFPLTEVRVEMGADQAMPPRIVGHAAVFNQTSEEIWGFHELIAPGAFAKTIQEADVRGLWNHNPDYILARTKSGTLRLSEDNIGLAIEILPPDTQWARDLMVSMQRGDVDQMSFGFRTVKERWDGTVEQPLRTLLEVELFDVSPVTFPAYPQTDVGVRAALANAGIDCEGLACVLRRSGERPQPRDRALILASIDALRRYLPDEPGRTPHSAEPPVDPQVGLRMLQRRLELAKRALI